MNNYVRRLSGWLRPAMLLVLASFGFVVAMSTPAGAQGPCEGMASPGCSFVDGGAPEPELTEAEAAALAAQDVAEGVPPRAGPNTFARFSTDELWSQIGPSGRAIVGLKNPGRRRGVWGDKLLIDAKQLEVAKAEVLHASGASPLRESEEFPYMEVELPSRESLDQLRRSPFVDYIEPAFGDIDLQNSCQLDEYVVPPQRPNATHPSGDLIPWHYADHGITSAWARSNGRGIRVSVVDTGVSLTNFDLSSGFATGASTGRSLTLLNRCLDCTVPPGFPPEHDTCSHGSRVATTIAAPLNGEGMVGIAWGADLTSIKFGNQVILEHDWGVELWDVAHAIWDGGDPARSRGARIIQMAFGSINYHHMIADVIRHHHARGILFVGAAGNVVRGVAFPARMEEVVAVSCMGYDLGLDARCSYGPEVDFTATTGNINRSSSHHGEDFPAQYDNVNAFKRMGQTSGASSTVAGIAALVWSVFPNENRDQILQRLRDSTGRTAPAADHTGFGNPNAYAAVGGFTNLTVNAPSQADPGERITLTALPTGLGPFSFRWSSGETTPSIDATTGRHGSTFTRSVTVTDRVEGRSRTGTVRIPVFSECSGGGFCN